MISQRLKQVILKELGLNDFNFDATTKAYEVPGWDSLSHVNVILAVEKEYQCRFTTGELLRLKVVEDLQVLVDAKSSAR